MQLCWELFTFSIFAFGEYVQEMSKPCSNADKGEVRRITMPLHYEAFKNTDKAGLLYEKFDAHLKLTHYKQRILNQFRKMCQIKIITKRSQIQIMACDK
jgi:hypothetical protein